MEWIEVSNKLPELNQRVLFYVVERDEIFCGYYIETDYRREKKECVFIESLDEWSFEDDTITHWMSCPNQPERLSPEDSKE